MKKLFLILVALVLVLSLSACTPEVSTADVEDLQDQIDYLSGQLALLELNVVNINEYSQDEIDDYLEAYTLVLLTLLLDESDDYVYGFEEGVLYQINTTKGSYATVDLEDVIYEVKIQGGLQ